MPQAWHKYLNALDCSYKREHAVKYFMSILVLTKDILIKVKLLVCSKYKLCTGKILFIYSTILMSHIFMESPFISTCTFSPVCITILLLWINWLFRLLWLSLYKLNVLCFKTDPKHKAIKHNIRVIFIFCSHNNSRPHPPRQYLPKITKQCLCSARMFANYSYLLYHDFHIHHKRVLLCML